MKYLKTLFLAAVLCLALARGGALAEASGCWSYEVTESGLTITAYTGADADSVVIPDELDGRAVTAIGGGAFEGHGEIRSLTIPEGIASIGPQAFYGCVGLSSLAFNARDCAVPEVWIFDDDKGAGVFAGAGSASPIGLTVTFGPEVSRVPDHLFDTASLEEYGMDGHPFAYVTEADIPESVSRVGDCAFRGCRSLGAVIIRGSATEIGEDAFAQCASEDFHFICRPRSAAEEYAVLMWYAYEKTDVFPGDEPVQDAETEEEPVEEEPVEEEPVEEEPAEEEPAEEDPAEEEPAEEDPAEEEPAEEEPAEEEPAEEEPIEEEPAEEESAEEVPAEEEPVEEEPVEEEPRRRTLFFL